MEKARVNNLLKSTIHFVRRAIAPSKALAIIQVTILGFGPIAYRAVDPTNLQGFILFLSIQSALLLFWTLVFFQNKLFSKKGLAIVFLISFISIRLTPTLYENDYFLYYWDAKQFSETGNPYLAPPQDRVDPHSNEDLKIFSGIGFPSFTTFYPPFAQFLFLLFYQLSPSLEVFLWLVSAGGALCFFFAFRRLLQAYSIQRSSELSLLLLLHPMIQKEWFQSIHYDSYFAALLCLGLSWAPPKRGWRWGAILGLLINLKYTGALFVFTFKRNGLLVFTWVFAFFTICLLGPWLPFISNLKDTGHTIATFFTAWEMNPGPFRWIRELGLLLDFSKRDASNLSRIVLAISWFLGALRFARSRSSPPVKLFWIVFLFIWLSPVNNVWYYTWCLPWIIFLPKLQRTILIPIFALFPLSYAYYGTNQNRELFTFLWNIEHALVLIGTPPLLGHFKL